MPILESPCSIVQACRPIAQQLQVSDLIGRHALSYGEVKYQGRGTDTRSRLKWTIQSGRDFAGVEGVQAFSTLGPSAKVPSNQISRGHMRTGGLGTTDLPGFGEVRQGVVAPCICH